MAKPITLYTSASCPFCTRAKALLAHKGLTVAAELRVDRDGAARAQMIERSGRRSVPQIFVGDTHIGGFAELAALDRSGRLDALLAET